VSKLAAYFTLAYKVITIPLKKLYFITWMRLIKHFSYARVNRSFYIPAPLIAHLSKNYTNQYNDLITGTKLLDLAVKEATIMQKVLEENFVLVECGNSSKLFDFYSKNGFVVFDSKKLNISEADLYNGDCFVKMIKYV
jgi:hypothetical protein